MSVVSVPSGIDMYYEWHGDDEGTPVVFIRGTGGDSSRWLPQAEAYRPRYRCLLFDNRGSGKTSSPSGPYTVAMMAADTIGLLDTLGVERAHISGMSLGGAVAQHLAVHHPERVATLQLHGTWAKTRGYAAAYLSLLKKFLEYGGLDLYYEAAILYLFPPQFFIDHFDQVETILASMKANSSPLEGLRGQLEANLSHDLLAQVSSISAPTLITVGELDMCIPVQYSEELHEAIPGSQLEIFAGGSHLFGLQDPDTFNRVTLAWLDRQLAAGYV
jgi:pimeloyl-ACP methyl ester carboxylesterase